MSKGHLELILRTVCLAVGLVAWGGSAHATIYRSGLDPTYSNGFADIDVPASCVISDGFESGSCGTVNFLDATITITDPPTPDFTVTWGFVSNGITGLLWSGGNLLGVDGGPFRSASPVGQYDLVFDSSNLTAAITCHQNIDSIVANQDESTLCTDLAGDPAMQEGFQPVSVPEPGSLILLLGAVGAACLSRRKREIM